MAWKPVHKEPEDSAWKALVSRAAMLLVGLALLFASYKCISKGMEISADLRDRGSGVRLSGRSTAIFWLGALATGLPGLALTVAGVMPTSFMERFVGD